MIDKLAWIVVQDKHILSTKSVSKEKYYIPGGKRGAREHVLLLCAGKLKRS